MDWSIPIFFSLVFLLVSNKTHRLRSSHFEKLPYRSQVKVSARMKGKRQHRMQINYHQLSDQNVSGLIKHPQFVLEAKHSRVFVSVLCCRGCCVTVSSSQFVFLYNLFYFGFCCCNVSSMWCGSVIFILHAMLFILLLIGTPR